LAYLINKLSYTYRKGIFLKAGDVLKHSDLIIIYLRTVRRA